MLEAELTVASYFKQTVHSGPTMEEVFFLSELKQYMLFDILLKKKKVQEMWASE